MKDKLLISKIAGAFGVAVLFFGGKKLPGLGSALGESIRNFKSGLKEGTEEAKKSEALLSAADPSKKEVL